MPTTMKITTPGETRGPVFAYLFDDGGDLLERAEVTDGAVKLRASKAKVLAGRLLLAPDIGEEATPSVLERARAFEPLLGRDSIPDVVTVPDSIISHWPWCICLIKGRVERADGRPVCDARVHICEVDSIPQLIARLPDRDIVRLRDDLLVAVREPVIPIPIPDPRPLPDPFPRPQPGLAGTRDLTIGTRPDFRVDGPTIGRVTRPIAGAGGAGREAADEFRRATPDATLRTPEIDPQVRRQLTSQAVPTVRQALAAQPHLILPWLCHWRWLWPWLRCDEIAVVETDDGGEFQRLYFHDCSDTPDLYFWVEFDFGDGWETVHRPPMPCNVHWNHDCSDEIVVTVKDPRVPTCAGTPTGNHDVNILSLGNEVAVREVQDATAGPAAEGLTTAGEPFGATIEPRVDFAPSLDGSGTSFYRWSARRLSGPDGEAATVSAGSVAIGAWFPLTRTVVRHYREQTSAGTSYPALTLGPLPSSTAPAPNLFQIPPVMTPAGDAQWRVLDQHEDLASAHFETASLLGSPTAAAEPDLAAGRYELKLELFDAAGDLVNWTDAGIEVGITDQDAAFGTGTVTTSPAPEGNRILDGDGDTIGFRMVIRVDNNRCSADVLAPAGIPLDGCGFHAYPDTSHTVGLSFDAGHPNGFATWSYSVVRGTEATTQVAVGGNVGQNGPTGWSVSGQTHSNNAISVDALLGSCARAAFSQSLHVQTLAQNGYSHLNGYNASSHGAFALVPLVAED